MDGHFGTAIAWLFLAIGINLPPTNFFGGMFLAMSAAYLAAVWLPETNKRELYLTLCAAGFLATLAAISHTEILPDWPFQLKAALLGLFSRPLISTTLIMSRRFVTRADSIADNLIDKTKGRRDD